MKSSMTCNGRKAICRPDIASLCERVCRPSRGRLLNNGITPSKSTTAQIDEQCGMLEAWSEVDKDLAELNGNTNEFRLSEAMAFIEAMDEQMAQTLFYGNANVTPESFTGYSVRFGAISGAGNKQNVIDAGGTGSVNASIYLIVLR